MADALALSTIRATLKAIATDNSLAHLLAKLHDQRLIVATTADSTYESFVFNWLESVQRAGVRHPLVLCLDQELDARLRETGRVTSFFHSSARLAKTKRGDGRLFNTAEFSSAVRMKTLLQHAILKLGFDLLFTDVDAPWATDLRPFMISASLGDQTGSNIVGDRELRVPAPLLLQLNFPNNDTNPGVFFARSTPMVVRLFELTAMAGATRRMRELLGFAGDDQQCLNFILACGDPNTGETHGCSDDVLQVRNRSLKLRTRACSITTAYKHRISREAAQSDTSVRYFQVQCSQSNLTLRYGVLPPLLFRSGAIGTTPDRRHPIVWPATPAPLMVHANFAQGHSQKFSRLKAAGLWFHNVNDSKLHDDSLPKLSDGGGESRTESSRSEEIVVPHWPPRTASARTEVAKGIAYLGCRQTLNSTLLAGATVELRYAGHNGPGGIGSMLQDTVLHFSRARRPTAVVGNLRWYTANSVCDALGTPGLSCFFRPVLAPPTDSKSTCESQSSFSVPWPQGRVHTPEDRSAAAWWWGVAHAYLFRPNEQLNAAVSAARRALGLSDAPSIAVHLRRSDKLNDRDSRQTKQPLTVESYLTAVEQLAGKMQRELEGAMQPVEVFVATDSAAAAEAVAVWAARQVDLVVVRIANRTETQRLSSADGSHLSRSSALAHRAYASSDATKYQIAVEALTDMLLLSSARVLIGLCMSQLARVAAILGFARGNLRDAIALDSHNLHHADQWKHGIHEGWRALTDMQPPPRQSARGASVAVGRRLSGEESQEIVRRVGLTAQCWRPPARTLGLNGTNEGVLEDGSGGSVYSDWTYWRWSSRHCPHDRGRPADAKLSYDSLPSPDCESERSGIQLSVLVQGYKAPASLRHSFASWQTCFLTQELVSDVVFYFNARNESVDDALVHKLMLPTGIQYTVLGDGTNHNLGYTITRMLAIARSELVLFLEKDWYVPTNRQAVANRALAAAASLVRFSGVDFVRMVRSISINNPEAAQWICGTRELLLVCSASRWAEWTNNPFVARASWVRDRLRWVAMQSDPLLYGCHHHHKKNRFIDIEELFHRRVLPWSASNWVVASFLDRGTADQLMLKRAAASGLTRHSKEYPWFGVFQHKDVDGHYVSY